MKNGFKKLSKDTKTMKPQEIKALRNKRGETLKQFAEHFGMSPITIMQWEAPESLISHRKPGRAAEKILDTLKI